MANQTNEFKAREYVFDLGNTAKENGFKPGESWELSLASPEEKSAIERSYYPTVSAKVMPEALAGLLELVKARLQSLNMKFANISQPAGTGYDHLQYLVAFNPDRRRR